MKILSVVFTLFLSSVSFAQSLTVKSDAVTIEFIAEKQNTKGTIGGFEADIKFDPNALANSTITGKVDVSTLDTGNKKRDKHLKSKDFFEAEKYPKIKFESTSITKSGDSYTLKGNVTMKGITHEEEMTFTFENNTFVVSFTIDTANYDFGSIGKSKKSKVTIKMTIPVS